MARLTTHTKAELYRTSLFSICLIRAVSAVVQHTKEARRVRRTSLTGDADRSLGARSSPLFAGSSVCVLIRTLVAPKVLSVADDTARR